jgi:hypothetical protein
MMYLETKIKHYVNTHRFCVSIMMVDMRSRPEKFFHEMKNNPHLDSTYGTSACSLETLHVELRMLFTFFLSLTKSVHVHPVLMYGGLIGYHLNGEMLPWDDDLDMIVIGEEEIRRLVSMDGWENDQCVFKVNPNYINKDPKDENNKMDARLISKRCGVFIDVMFFWPSVNSDHYWAKDGNTYQREHLLPLRTIRFMNAVAYIPNQYVKCLEKRYGPYVCVPSAWNLHKGRWVKSGFQHNNLIQGKWFLRDNSWTGKSSKCVRWKYATFSPTCFGGLTMCAACVCVLIILLWKIKKKAT